MRHAYVAAFCIRLCTAANRPQLRWSFSSVPYRKSERACIAAEHCQGFHGSMQLINADFLFFKTVAIMYERVLARGT